MLLSYSCGRLGMLILPQPPLLNHVSIFTVTFFSGGLEAVTFTDILQVSIMLIGAMVLTILGGSFTSQKLLINIL